ncbi:hypothetical protein NX059_000924 [Plenodomus lindquistii]|nr:hypothetical protein NX059_000924 [Plenodomus lindquistii]
MASASSSNEGSSQCSRATSDPTSKHDASAVTVQKKAPRRGLRRTETCASTLPLPDSFVEYPRPADSGLTSTEPFEHVSRIPETALQHLQASQRNDSDGNFADLINCINNSSALVQELIDLFPPVPETSSPIMGDTFNNDSGVSDIIWPESSLASSSSSFFDLSSSSSETDSDELLHELCLDPRFPGHSPCTSRIEGLMGYPAQYAIRHLRRRFEAAHTRQVRHRDSVYLERRNHKIMVGKNGQLNAFWGSSPLVRGLKGRNGARFVVFVDPNGKAGDKTLEAPSRARSEGRLDLPPPTGDSGGFVFELEDAKDVVSMTDGPQGQAGSPLEEKDEHGNKYDNPSAGIESAMLFDTPYTKVSAGDDLIDDLAEAADETPFAAPGTAPYVNNAQDDQVTAASSIVKTSVIEHDTLSQAEPSPNDADSNEFLTFIANQTEGDEYEEARSRFLEKVGAKIVVEQPTLVKVRMEVLAFPNKAEEHTGPGVNSGCLAGFGDIMEVMNGHFGKLELRTKVLDISQKTAEKVKNWAPSFWPQ